MTRFYLAARYSRRAEIHPLIPVFRAYGMDLQARWLHGVHEIVAGTAEDVAQLRRVQFAVEDYEDVERARFLVLYNPAADHGIVPGGHHVEVGARSSWCSTTYVALALGKPVILVGPPENVFHYHPGVTFIGDVPLDQLPEMLGPLAQDLAGRAGC